MCCTTSGAAEGVAASVTASEFAFLAMGLILGLGAGAALVEVVRARPPAAREVRVTMSTDAVPRRRATTLADEAFSASPAEPARGGPADRRDGVTALPGGTPDRRTAVLSASPSAAAATVGVGEGLLPGRIMEPVFRLAGPAVAANASGRDPAPAHGVPVSGGMDPMLGALRASAAASAQAAMRIPTATAVLDQAGAPDEGGRDVSGHDSADETCAELRRVADERCELATRSRAPATTAEDALRTAQRAYDDHESRSEQAHAAADPRAVRHAKDEAQARFRAGRGGATTTEEVEAAARAWLTEVNSINAAARDAALVIAHELDAARALGADLERRSLEADAARISAETSEAACLAAREAVADCDEGALTDGSRAHLPTMPGRAPGGPFPDGGSEAEGEPLTVALGGGGIPRVFRLVRGDRAAMGEVVAALAGDDPEERRRWQLAVSDLVDAILADAIEAGALSFPLEHPFWGPFTIEQARNIVGALSSLGYRFDGLGGWLDGRIPSQRDLSLALGYAGLDPMRMRQWPDEAAMAELFREVTVAADEHLASAAGDLSLGELVTMLGRRADGLADVWNRWGHLRPLLLDES